MKQLQRAALLAYISIAAAEAPCTTAKCKAVADYILKSLAPNYTALDPCVDFEQYACNGWINTHEISPSMDTTTPPSVLADENDKIMQAVLSGPYVKNTTLSGINPYDGKNFETIQKVYATCMNDSSIRAYGVKPLRKMLDEFEAVYPAGPANSSQGLTDALAWLFKRDISSMIALTNVADSANNYTANLQFSLPGLPYASFFFELIKPVAAQTVAEMFQVVSSGKPIDAVPLPSNSSLLQKGEHVVEYEKVLFPYLNATDNHKIEWTTLKKVQSVLPEINFQAFFTGIAPPGFRIDANQTIGVYSMDYYRNLSKIITSTPRETLHDYFQWQLIAMWADRLHDSYTAPIQRYENQLLERPQNFTVKRPDTCRLEGDFFLPYLWDGAFVQRAFTMEDKRLGEKIVKELKKAIIEDARTQEWMSDPSKKALAAKVSNMVEIVGFQTSNPNEGDPRELNEYYAQLKLGDSYFENGLAYSQFRQARFWATLFKVYNRDKMSLQPVDYRLGKVTMPSDIYIPLYVGDVNMIDVPAGTMQMPRFGVDIPEYVTYAAWGSTIMHEILTGLYGDEQYRRLFDNSTAGRYKNGRDCFAKQYQQYLTADFKNVTQDKANNDFSVDWMLGDRHSLRITHAAWKAHSSDEQNTALPGLEKFTNDQLFFINYANSLCAKTGKTLLPIPVNYKRIVAALPESTDFRKAFNCPAKPPTCPL